MVSVGYFLSCEEFGPKELVRQARMAADHFHPWLDAQGQNPFVWSVIGALSDVVDLPITTAVTCPTVRIHPAVPAQAAATAAVRTGGRFALGGGFGEALNEHIFGDPWPSADVRLEMLEEAVDVIRLLHGGGTHSHRGRRYTVTPDMLSQPAGPDPRPYVERVRAFADAGFDEVHVAQIGPYQEEFFRFWQAEVAPALVAR